MKKPDHILSLPEMSICSEMNRKKRCRHEPKCQHVNCLRNALENFLSAVIGGQGQNIELRKVKMDMMLVLLRMISTAIQINASVYPLIKLLLVNSKFY